MIHSRSWFTAFNAVFMALYLAACSGGSAAGDVASTGQSTPEDASIYEVRGRIEEIRRGGEEVVIAHEDIPGFMAAMTMPFAARPGLDSQTYTPGDLVRFRLVVSGASSWVEGVAKVDRLDSNGFDLFDEVDPPLVSNESLYQLESEWRNQTGASVRLVDLAGRPVVLAMVFTRCAYACPLLVTDMKKIGAQLDSDDNERVRYVLVSLDPDRDTPESLRHFARAHGLDASQWTLLTGTHQQVRMLAALLGIRYRMQDDGQIAHTSLITVLDGEGEILHRQKGLGADESATVAALRTAIASGA